MATTKKTNTDTKETVVTETTKPEMKPKKFKLTDGILCKSITSGTLLMVGTKTGNLYEWADYNDELEVEYQDLLYLIRSKSRFIFEPFFIIDDEDVIEQNPTIAELYKDIYSVDDLENIFNLSINQMRKAIEALPKGAKETVKILASQNVSNGRLDSIKKIKVLDEIFDTELLNSAALLDS